MHNDGIFSSDFGAHIVGKDGLPTQVHLDRHEFYHGYLHGEGSHAYRGSGFNCKYLLIANCEFFYVSQLIDSQT